MLTLSRSLYEVMPESLRSLFELVPQPFTLSAWYREGFQAARLDLSGDAHIERLQAELLSRTLSNACEDVPYYVERRSHLPSAAAINCDPIEALQAFPIMRREDIAAAPHLFVSSRANRLNSFRTSTGGTTGAPLAITSGVSNWFREWGTVYGYLASADVHPRDWRISLRGVAVLSATSRDVEVNSLYRELRVSPFLSAEKMRAALIEAFERREIRWIHAYPSALEAALSALGNEARRLLGSLKAVLLVSENLSQIQAERFRDIIGVPILSFYGHSERACFASLPPSGHGWMPLSLYGLTEIINDRLVVTGFHNRVMPFIRYDTDDAVAKSELSGVLAPGAIIPEIEGRWNGDALIGSEGQLLTTTALNSHLPEQSMVRRMQFIQLKPGLAELRMDLGDHPRPIELAQRIASDISLKCRGSLTLVPVVTTVFHLTARGKLPRVVRQSASTGAR